MEAAALIYYRSFLSWNWPGG